MKLIHLLGLIACISLVNGCESDNSAGTGNQEEKRKAALRQQEQQSATQSDENLQSAHRDIINRDSNPSRY
jgi:hypothetical protein